MICYVVRYCYCTVDCKICCSLYLCMSRNGKRGLTKCFHLLRSYCLFACLLLLFFCLLIKWRFAYSIAYFKAHALASFSQPSLRRKLLVFLCFDKLLKLNGYYKRKSFFINNYRFNTEIIQHIFSVRLLSVESTWLTAGQYKELRLKLDLQQQPLLLKFINFVLNFCQVKSKPY